MIPPSPFPFEGDLVNRYGAEFLDIRWPDEWKAVPGWRPYNPSVAWHDGHLYLTVRYSFFAFPGIDITGHVLVSSGYYGRSETLFAELDPDTMQVKWWTTLTYRNWKDSRNTALEDVRIWSDGDLYGIGVFLHEDATRKHSQAIIRIDPKKRTATLVQVLPTWGRSEKNWSPVEGRPEFTYSPTQHYLDGVVHGDPYTGKVHGGTQLIEFDDGYLSLVHTFVHRRYRRSAGRSRVGRHYMHYWAKWDQDLILTHRSAPFVFTWDAAIEFASGLTRHGDRLLVSYGWGDYDLTLCTVDPTTIPEALEPFTEPAKR